MTALLFLIGAWLVGVWVVRRVLSRVLDGAEQTLWGLVAGWMLATLTAYALARALGRLSGGATAALAIALAVAAVALWSPAILRLVQRRARDLRGRWRAKYVGLLVVVALFAPVYAELYGTRMLRPDAGAVYSGGSTWYDIGLHLAISTSFAYGENFPPVYTPFPPEPLLYPFMPDFLTAALVALGLDLRAALLWTCVPLALALTGIMYSFARHILRADEEEETDDASPAAASSSWASAALATILFLLNGGLGFLYFFGDWRGSGRDLAQFWQTLEINYANMPERQIYWTSLVGDTLLPQRASLFGLPAALMIFTAFAIVWRNWSGRRRGDASARGRWDGWRVLLPAGVVTGLLPLFHMHSYGAVGLVSGLLFLLRPRRAWLAFWLPAVALALPHFAGLAGHVAGAGFMRLQPGWRYDSDAGGSGFPLFWLMNVGLPALLILPAWLAARREWRVFYLAFAGLLVFSLLLVVSPNDYDQIKLMYYWYAPTCALVAAWLVRLASGSRAGLLLASILALACVASGLLALQHESVNVKQLFSADEAEAARFVGEHTPPRSLFLTAPTVHQPILSLSGRAVVRGDTAWLWSHGYDFPAREADVRAIYAGGDDATELLRHYRVDFIYLGHREREMLKANQDFFERHLPLFYQRGDIRIYDARPLTRAPGDADASDAAAARRFREPYPPREFAARLDKDPAQLLVEFPRAAFAVYRYYKVARGSWPEYGEFMEDLRAVGRGVYVGASGWERVLEGNKLALTDAWPAREEFRRSFDALGEGEFVGALYANAGVELAREERDQLVAALEGGAETRASVLRHVAEERELYRRDYDAAYVLTHYFGYLRRGPADPPDKDLDGFNFWLRILQRTDDYRSTTRVFIESGEYKDQR